MGKLAFICLFSVCQANPGETRVASPVKGFVVLVAVQKGEIVSAGQVLLRLDDRLARIDVRLADAKLSHIEALHQISKAALQGAEVLYERKRALVGSGAATKEELDAAKMLCEKYNHELRAKQAQLEIARLGSERARLVLEQHEVRAPFAGVVEEVLRGPGEGVAELGTVVRLRRK